MIFSLLFSKDFLWIEKSGAAGNEPCCLIRRCPQNGARGPGSRQKPEGMCDFCLPAGRNSVRAEPKVDKNGGKCVIFVYRLVEIQCARPRK
jgi:hypothetical protein